MDLRKQLLTRNDCYKIGAKLTPKGVMWHSTGANNPNLKRYVGPDDGRLGTNTNGNDWNQARPDGRKVCVHAFIGKDKNGKVCTYQTLPFNMKGWHCGGSGNSSYIGFEICEDGLTDNDYFSNVYKEAVEFTAYLCKQYGLDPMGKNVIICHQDGYRLGIASNHSDVYHWFNKHGKSMDDVRRDVKALMNGGTAVSTPAASSKPTGFNLAVDGALGTKSVKAMQTWLGTPVDGVVSSQSLKQKPYLSACINGVWKFGYNAKGSMMVKALQRKIGAGADGIMGKNTVIALQRFLGVRQDGYLGPNTAKALQSYLNRL